ncbi:hypothetical protein AJ79_07324 [Helicocarpus griseus UAMH5409]|uniref:MATH and UCH domain protein n=1 Tax=Helicocarpus griseus UAMH5409 TaxID=1447875 RepID=A0A2B7X3S2_9EURO|nr:hypothetical protein AJ79_07324 [Helicocarpus griseus UAMH5409]
MDVALDSPVNVERPVAPVLPHTSSSSPEHSQHSQPLSPLSSQSVMPPSSTFQISTSSHTTTAPDRPAPPQDAAPADINTEASSHAYASHLPPPQPVPQQQPLVEDSMDAAPDNATQPQSEEGWNPVPLETSVQPSADDSAPTAMESDQNANSNAEDAQVGDSTPTDAEAPVTSTTDGTVAEPTMTELPATENEPQDEPSLQEPSSDTQAEQDSPQEESQNDSHGSPVEEEEHAYWADIEEDTSAPDEAELKEIESENGGHSALDYNHWEKCFYREVDDPEYKPAEKARVTWKFKGVRGTKEKPNRATIMRSPSAYIGGIYWTLKFFPRGNNNTSLSVYIESSATPPRPDKDIPDTEFKVFKGPPDAVLSDLGPEVDITIPATAHSSKSTTLETSTSEIKEKQELAVEENRERTPTQGQENGEEKTEEPSSDTPRDWRVSAQIGLIVYNPEEPRTAAMQSSYHQFNSHNVDWGWTTFYGPWDQIHLRQRGQRQALLRNDTLAFDAYIRIFDDPTQSLWWHPSDTEPIWDSLSLTGYRPMGDSVVKYSPEVAGLVSWLLLAPFREIIQSVDVLEHLTAPNARPRPLCDALQRLLWALRSESTSPLHTETDFVTQTLRNLGEYSRDVMEFWERVRRTLELELAGTDAIEKLSKILDGHKVNNAITPDEQTSVNHFQGDFNNTRIRIPAQNADRVQSALKQHFNEKPGKWSLPAVLHVELARQKFDKISRHWSLIPNRVGLDEELDLSDITVEPEAGKYSLYGFVVHKGKRTSGQFYSILRPGGPGTRWLAFEDATDNKIECLTRKAAIDAHEGIGPEEARSHDRSGRDVAVIVMYVRNDVLPQFLTGKIEPWEVPEPRKHYFETGLLPFDSSAPVTVETYSLGDISLVNNSIFDAYDIMFAARSVDGVRHLTLPSTTTFAELRRKLALWHSKEGEEAKPENIRIWQIGHPKSGFIPSLQLKTIPELTYSLACFEMNVLRLWVHVLSEDDSKLFAVPEPRPSSKAFEYEREETDESAIPEDGSNTPTNQNSSQESNDSQAQDVGMTDSNQDSAVDPTPQAAESDGIDNLSSEQPGISEHPALEAETQQTEVSSPAEPNAAAAIESDPVESTADVQMSGIEPDSNSSQPVQTEAVDENVNTTDVDSQNATEPTEQANTSAAEVQAGTEPSPVEQSMDILESSGNDTSHPVIDDTANVPTPAPDQEDLIMQDPPVENPSTDAPPNENQETDAVPDSENNINDIAEQLFEDPNAHLVPLSEQTYYFVQIFQPQKQAFDVVGVFLANKRDVIKSSVRAALGWPESKQFHLWHRVDGVSILSISGTEKFSNIVSSDIDGECFVVGEVLPKSECITMSENGSFSSPDLLAQYLWALSRRHPTQAFTGTKTLEATFNGDYYSGDIKKGYYHGKGTHISDTGATYTGDFVLGERQGKGIMEFASGDTYDGDWFEDERHGQGTFIERKTGNKYVGGYRAGKRHGKGISYWEVADEEMDLCQICYSEDQDALFYMCGHVCACVSCAKQVDICPMCRKKVTNVVKIYRS